MGLEGKDYLAPPWADGRIKGYGGCIFLVVSLPGGERERERERDRDDNREVRK